MGRRGAAKRDEQFSFVNPVVKYLLFFFNTIFWLISVVLIGIGVYARISKHDMALACLTVDPSILLLTVGVFMFFLTFCGCVGSLRENICLLQTFCICLTVIFLLQLVAGILGFVFSDKVRYKVTEMINNAIKHYRDDTDLQNLIDFGQKERTKKSKVRPSEGTRRESTAESERRKGQPNSSRSQRRLNLRSKTTTTTTTTRFVHSVNIEDRSSCK